MPVFPPSALTIGLILSLSLTLGAQSKYDYETDIAPILEQYCVKCHGSEKQKSGYRLDTYKSLLTPGDSEEAPIDPGYATTSPLIEYLLLPKSDDYAMPPEGEDTPTGDEILRIAHWIYEGAKSEVDLRAALPINELVGKDAFAAIERLREQNAIIHKQGQNDPGIFVDLQDLVSTLNESDIRDLILIAPYVEELRMTRLRESVGDLAWLRAFTRLEKLDLSHSPIGDESVASINKLQSLEILNLYGTRLTDKGLSALKVPTNGKLYLGGTKVRRNALNRVNQKRPNIAVYGSPDLNAALAITDNALGNSSTFNPVPEIEPGAQVSEQGIRHGFLISGRLTAIFDENSDVTWLGPRGARDGMVLDNGNVLLSVQNEAREYLSDSYDIVWSYRLDKRNKELGAVSRLPNGNTLIVERGSLPRLLEVDHRGDIVLSVPLQPETDNDHMQTRMARKLSNGNYLVPHLLAFKVKEYDPVGNIVNSIPTDLESIGGREAENWPFTAIRLPNGNTVVNLTHGNKTVEFAPDNSIAWVCDNSHVDGRFSDPCGGQRLPNGNTVVASYGQKDPEKVKLFEVNPNNEVVWEFFHPEVKAHQVHVLTTNGQAISPIYR